MPGKHVVVDVSPTRVEIVQLQGRRAAVSHSERLEPADWATEWPAILSTLDGPLANLVAKHGLKGSQATILYAGPTAVSAVFACPTSAGRAAAEQAAALALAGLCTFPLADNPHAMWRMATDGSEGPVGSGTNAHTLAIADTDASASAVADWARRAGLRPTALLPGGTLPMVLAVRTAMEGKAGDPPRAVLWIGEHGSVLAAGHAGRVLFVRGLALGTESLVEALARPVRTNRDDGRTVSLDRAKARQLLELGIPQAGDVLDAELGIDGAGVLPLLQPILQRIAIETKQSLRFGLGEEDRARVRLLLIGPGSKIDRLGDMLGRQCGAKFEPPAQGADPSDRYAAGADALCEAATIRTALLPRSVEQGAMVRRLRAGLWAGAAVSLALIGAEWTMATGQIERSSADLQKIKAAASDRTARTEIQDRAVAARARAARLEQRVWKELGEPADWAAVLALLGEATSPKVRLTDIEMTADKNGPTCRLHGSMLAGAGSDPAGVITKYIDELSAVPIVKSVRLGATQRTETGGGQGQRFELSVGLIGLPPTSLIAGAEAPRTGGNGR